MAILMKESNDILSSVYRASPSLFQRFIPPTGVHLPVANILQFQSPASLSPAQSSTDLEQQNCTPPTSSSSSSTNCSSPLDFNSILNAASSSTPVMSPHASLLTMQQQQQAPTKTSSFEIRNFLNSPETICETAARLLFMCVRWAKSIPAFVNLDMSDQVCI